MEKKTAADGGEHPQGKPKGKASEHKTSNEVYGQAPASKSKHTAGNAGHDSAGSPAHAAAAPKETGLTKLIHQGEHLLVAGEKMLTKALGSHDGHHEKTAAPKRPEIPNKVANADKLSPEQRRHQQVSDYTDPVTKKHSHYNEHGFVDKVHAANGAVTTIAYKHEGNADKPVAFTTVKENHPNLLQSACASDNVVLKVDQRTGAVTTSCHQKVTVLDEHHKPATQELKIERQFSSDGASSEVRSDLKGHRIDKSIVGPDNKPVAVIHYDYRHGAGKSDAHKSVMAVQMDALGRPVHQFVFATADDIDKQKPAMREDRKYSQKDGLVKETHKVFELHTGKDVPIFQCEQTIDLVKGRTTIHEETFKDGKKTPVESKTVMFNQSGKPIEMQYKNEETKTDVSVSFTSAGKAADVKGRLGELDKQYLLHRGDVEVGNALAHYHVKAIETADRLAHGGPTPPRQGDKPTGTVAWREGETYKQGSVVDGKVLDAGKLVIGTVNDAGDVEIGNVKFNILSDRTHAAVFHGVGTDNERLELCLGQATKGGAREEGYNGYLTDGTEKMTAIGGNIFDHHGKFFAHMDEKGQLVFADDADQKEKFGTGLSTIKSGGGWQFIGNENGKARQFDVDNSSNGTVFVAQLDAKGTPVLDAAGHPIDPIKCVVHMGMLIDSTNGKQIGKFVPPAINDDKSWGEGGVLLFGKNPGDKPNVTALSSMKNTIFDVTTTGQGTTLTMRGAVVGPKEVQADGSTRPGVGGIVNFDQAIAVSEQNSQNKKAALDERIDTESEQRLAVGIVTHDVTGINARLYNKAIAGEAQTEAAQVSVDLAAKQVASQKERIDQLLSTGKLDENTIYSLQRMTTLNKAGGSDNLALLKQRVENPQHVLEDLRGSAQIYSGSVKRPDPENPGKIIDYDVRRGYVYKKNSDHIIGSVNPADGSLRLLNDAGGVEVSKMADPTLKGAVIHLECPSASGKATSVDWVNDGRGQLISIGQLRKQAAEERAYAELMAKGERSGTTNKEALERTKILEDRYNKTLNNIVQNGISDVNSIDRFSSLEQLKGGPQAYVKAEQYRPEPHAAEKKISLPKFESQEDCQRASGPMRLGHDHFVVDKGVIYRARLEGKQWKRDDKPCGSLEANYVAKIDGHAVVLRDQSQFLFQLRLEGESQDHRIIGLGPSRTDSSGTLTPGGLVDANELLRQGAIAQNSTAVSANEYRDSEGYLTMGAPDALMGGREAQLDLVHDTAANQQRGLHRQIDQLFMEGLQCNTLATTDVNHNVRSVRNFVQDMHLSTDDASNLSAEGREMQKQSSEAVAMAALSLVPGGAGVLATRAGFGVVGQVGITLAGGGMISAVARQTHGGGWRQASENFASGSIEALTMWAGSEGSQLIGNLKMLQAAKIAGPEALAALSEPLKTLAANPMTSRALEILAKPGGGAVLEGILRTANASVQITGFATAGSIRSGNYDEFTATKMAEGTLYMLAGEGLAALAHHPLTKMGTNVPLPFGKGFEKGMETFSGGAINNFTNSVLNARGQADLAEKDHIAQQLGLKPEQVTPVLFEKYKNQGRINAFILRSGAEGAAMTVITHPVSHTFNHFLGERINARNELTGRGQLHSEQIASIEARINAIPLEELSSYSAHTIKNDVGLETTLVQDHNGRLNQVALPDGTVLTRGENQWAASKPSSTFSEVRDVTADGQGNISIKHANNSETNINKDGRATERSVLTEGHEVVKTSFPDGRQSRVETVDGKVTALTMQKSSLPGELARPVEEKRIAYDEHGNLKSVEEFSGGVLLKDESGWSLYYSGNQIEKGSYSDVRVLADGTIVKEGKSRQDGSSLSITDYPDGSKLILKNGVVQSVLDAKGFETRAVRDADGNLAELRLPQGDRLIKGGDGWSVQVSGHPPEYLCKEVRLETDGSVVHIDEHGIASTNRLDGSRSIHVPGDAATPVRYNEQLEQLAQNILLIDDSMQANHIQEGLLDLHDRLRTTHGAPDEEMAKVLYEVNRLLKEPGCVSEERRWQWVDEALSLAANPDLLSQGTNGTCPLASSEQREYALHPDTWFKMLRRLNETGVAVNSLGGVIGIYGKGGQFDIAPDQGSLSHYDEPGRTRRDASRLEVSQVVQTVLNDVVGNQNHGRKDIFYASDIEPMMKLVTGRDEKFVISQPLDSKDMVAQLLAIKERGNLYAILEVDCSHAGANGMLTDQGHVRVIKDVRSSLSSEDMLSPESLADRFRLDGIPVTRTDGDAVQPSYELDTRRIEMVLGNTWSRSKSDEVFTADQAYYNTIRPKSNEHLDWIEVRISANPTEPHERLELLSWKLGILNASVVHKTNNTSDVNVDRALNRLNACTSMDSAQMLHELSACEAELKGNYIERARLLGGDEAAQQIELKIDELLEQRRVPSQGGVELSLKDREYVAALGHLKRALVTLQAMEIDLAKRSDAVVRPPTVDLSSPSMPEPAEAGAHRTAMVSNDVQRAVGVFQDAAAEVDVIGRLNSDALRDRLAMRTAKDDFAVRNPADVYNKGDSQALDTLLFRQLKIDDHPCFQNNVMRTFIRTVRDETQGWTALDREHPATAALVEQRKAALEKLLGKYFNDMGVIAPKIEIIPDELMGIDDAAYVPGQGVVQMRESRFHAGEPLKIEEVGHEALGHLWQDHLLINKVMLDALRNSGRTKSDDLTLVVTNNGAQEFKLTPAGEAFCKSIAAQELSRSEELVQKCLLANPHWISERLTKTDAELQSDAQYMRAARLTESFARRRDAGDDQLHSLTNLLMGRKLDSRVNSQNIEITVRALLQESVDAPLPSGFNAEKALEAMTKSLNRFKLFGYDPLDEKYLIPGINLAGHEAGPRIDRAFEDHLNNPQFFERNPNFLKDMVDWNIEADLGKKIQLREKWLATIKKEYPFDEFGEIGAPSSPKVLARFMLKADLFLIKHFKNGGEGIGGLSPEVFESTLPKLVRELIKDHLNVSAIRGYNSYRANFYELEAHFIHLQMKKLMGNNDVEHKPEEDIRQRTDRQLQYAHTFVPDKGGHPGWRERIIEIQSRAKAEADARKVGPFFKEELDFSSALQGLHQARESGTKSEDEPALNFKENAGIPDDYMPYSNSEQVATNTNAPPRTIKLDLFSDTPTKLTSEAVTEVNIPSLSPPPPLPYEHHQKLEAIRIQTNVNLTRISAKPNPYEAAPVPNERLYQERTPDLKTVEDLKHGAPLVELRRDLLREIKNDPAREQIDKNDPNQINLIQERKNRENEQAYARLSQIDPLTGAGTQQAVEEELIRRCEEAQKTKVPFSVAYVDLDEFGTANGVIGRAGGDLALKMYVEAMDRLLLKHPNVSLARLGGDEFVLIGSFDEKFLEEVRAIRFAYETRKGNAYVRLMKDNEIITGADPVRASIGAVAWRAGETPEQILKRADKEMQANKELRKFDHPLRVFKPEIDSTKAPSADAITSKFQRSLSMTSEEFRVQNPDLFAKIDDRLNEASVDRLMLAKRLYTHHLTELPKDFVCQRVLGREVVQANQAANSPNQERKLFLIKADINNFKSVNDENDHSQGDALLKIYGANLREIVGSGKDKFVGSPGGGAAFIIAHSEAEKDAIIKRLEDWQGPAEMQPKDKYKLSLSVGVAEWAPGMSASKLDQTAEDVLKSVKLQQESAGIRKSREQYAIDAKIKEEQRRASRNINDRGKQI